ncbi:MAG: hypothetical protein OEW86_05495 [Nitrosopumilus sp.]|nr:hypothetical protein [Nitrosopumilus sp.]
MNPRSTTKPKRVIPTFRIFAKAGMFQDYKACPHCGQNEFPFKKGICSKCCKQIGDVQYVKDPKEYVESNYGNVKMGIEAHKGLNGL